MRILHVSDLHFGRFFLPEVGERLLESAAALQPDVIVVSGDLTQRAKVSEFAAFAAFAKRLPAAINIVVPGNHDVPLYRVWERMFAPRRLYRRFVNSQVDTVHVSESAVFVGLDSSDPYRSFSNGRIGQGQIDWCRGVFADVGDGPWRVLVLHHHLLPPPTFERRRPMPRSRRLLDALTQMRVDVVLGGHLHRAYIGNSLDVYAGEERDHGMIVVQCGTTTSRRGRGFEREKNTFNLIDLEGGELRLSHFLYFTGGEKFVESSRHVFARPTLQHLGD